MEKDERSIGERWYEIEDRRMGEAFEEAAARRKVKSALVLVDSDTGRVWVLGDGKSWFRDGGDAKFTTKFSPPMPDDLSENFAAITGSEADALVREAAQVKA